MLQKHGKNPKFVKFRIFKIHNKNTQIFITFSKKKKFGKLWNAKNIDKDLGCPLVMT